MKKRLNIRKFAKKLLSISRTNGLLDDEKIAAVLNALPKEPNSLSVLREYYSLLKRAISKERLLIFSDNELLDEERDLLVSSFERKAGRKVRVQTEIDPNLIAGVRAQLGDKIFEISVRSTLATLSKK